MAYGGISPETPLTLSLSASRPTTQQSSTTATTFDMADQFPLADGSTLPTTAIASMQLENQQDGNDSLPVGNQITVPPQKGLAQPWSRPSSSSGSSASKAAHQVGRISSLHKGANFQGIYVPLHSDCHQEPGALSGENQGSCGWPRSQCWLKRRRTSFQVL